MKVYTLTSRTTGKCYVGATTLSMPRRCGAHKQDAARGKKTLIAQAIREHGWGDFDVAVIATATTHAQLLLEESKAIARLGTLHPNGYNRSSFGANAWRFTDAEKQRISDARMGMRPWNYGLSTGPMPESVKEKQRVTHIGQKAWNKGIAHTDESRLRMREAHASMERHYNERAIEYQGTTYRSIAIACHMTGLTKMQMKYRLRKGEATYVSPPREKEK